MELLLLIEIFLDFEMNPGFIYDININFMLFIYVKSNGQIKTSNCKGSLLALGKLQ